MCILFGIAAVIFAFLSGMALIVHELNRYWRPIMNYVTVKTYFKDLSILDNRLKAIEHILDIITKKEVEELSEKEKRSKDDK